MSEPKIEADEIVKLLIHLKVQALKLTEQLDTTPRFKQKLRERIAAGEWAMRSAVEDLGRSLP